MAILKGKMELVDERVGARPARAEGRPHFFAFRLESRTIYGIGGSLMAAPSVSARQAWARFLVALARAAFDPTTFPFRRIYEKGRHSHPGRCPIKGPEGP